MQTAFNLAKINPELLIKRINREDIKVAYIKDTHKILVELLPIAELVHETYDLCDPKEWEHYERMGIKGLAEQEELSERLAKFKSIWKKMPRFTKEHYVKKTKKKAKSSSKSGSKTEGTTDTN